MEPFAVLSDIHANIWALEAVLDDLARRGLRQILNLGDTLFGPLEPQATADRLMQLPLVSLQGNQDRLLFQQPAEPRSATLAFVLGELSSRSLEWLAAQPATCVVAGALFLCHGTPRSDLEYLLEKPSLSSGILQDPSVIQTRLGPLEQKVVLCGHTHISRLVQLPSGTLVVNPGRWVCRPIRMTSRCRTRWKAAARMPAMPS